MHGHANIVWVGTVSPIWVNSDPERVSLRVVEALALYRSASRSGGENVGEVADLPDSIWAFGLRETDVVDQDGPRGAGRSSDALEKIAELLRHLESHVGYFPFVISIT